MVLSLRVSSILVVTFRLPPSPFQALRMIIIVTAHQLYSRSSQTLWYFCSFLYHLPISSCVAPLETHLPFYTPLTSVISRLKHYFAKFTLGISCSYGSSGIIASCPRLLRLFIFRVFIVEIVFLPISFFYFQINFRNTETIRKSS